jgi:hypothetical protein
MIMGNRCDLSSRKKREIKVMLKNTAMKTCEIAVACKVSPERVGRIK